MFRKTLVLSAVLAGFSAADAEAMKRGTASPEFATMRAQRTDVLQLAQSGDVEIYYDGRGRRVLVDSYTGEILAIQEPRRQFNRESQRRAERERELRRPGRYYL
ncbi:hypothetical protein AB4144_21610, partial [Rhizobiaceae sp. 2RAB30]